jgi:hypothetical protein
MQKYFTVFDRDRDMVGFATAIRTNRKYYDDEE